MTVGKLAAGIAAGTTGAGSMGVLADILVRIAAAHAVPAAMWAAIISLIMAPTVVATLALILDYRLKKIKIESDAELLKTRQAMYRVLVEKAAGEPARMMSYLQLIDADARHLSVERNLAQPADQAPGHTYGPGSPASGSRRGSTGYPFKLLERRKGPQASDPRPDRRVGPSGTHEPQRSGRRRRQR